MQIRLIQTADAERYKVLFDITSRASARYCAMHQLDFHPFIGIKRGYHPWQATFNRILMLSEMLEEGFCGWILYLDADAYPFDLQFDVRSYLNQHSQWGIIAASGGHSAYLPNNGIMFFNLACPQTREVITAWHAAFLREFPLASLKADSQWSGRGDQFLLHPILHQRGDYDRLIKIESFDLIGWPYSSFLRQIMRDFCDFRSRCEMALTGVQEALAAADSHETCTDPPR